LELKHCLLPGELLVGDHFRSAHVVAMSVDAVDDSSSPRDICIANVFGILCDGSVSLAAALV
jgi:hypothetical protein